MSKLVRVMQKATKFHGVQRPETPTNFQVLFSGTKNYNSIALFQDQDQGMVKAGTMFQVGDEAEYGSYNLIYTGKITKITDKCVTIVAYYGSSIAKTHRLDLSEFCCRNFGFNAEKIMNHNHNEMMYI